MMTYVEEGEPQVHRYKNNVDRIIQVMSTTTPSFAILHNDFEFLSIVYHNFHLRTYILLKSTYPYH